MYMHNLNFPWCAKCNNLEGLLNVTVHAKRWDKSAEKIVELALDYENITPWEPL